MGLVPYWKDRAIICLLQFEAAFRPATYKLNDVSDQFSPAKRAIFLPSNSNYPLQNELKIVSWNVFEDRNDHSLNDGLRKIARDYNPDIVMLQEAPLTTHQFWDTSLFRDWHVLYAPDHFYDINGRQNLTTGNIILSRHPFEKTAVFDLPTVTWDFLGKDHKLKRNALYVQLKYGTKTIGLWNTHLEFYCRPDGRTQQAEWLVSKMRGVEDVATVAAMDGNAAYRIFGSRTFEPFLTTLAQAGLEDPLKNSLRMFPSFLDYIFVKGAKISLAKDLQVNGSDHKPVLTEIVLGN